MLKNRRTIENTWEMLKCLYSELRTKKFSSLDISQIDNIDDLYALVIVRWCTALAKEGLYKEYVTIENEELSSPKGQINLQQSIVMQTMSRGTLICSYDELSEDIYLNHILKGTLQYILFDNKISDLVKLEAKKVMQLYNGVKYIDITRVHWKSIKYNNSNIRYKHLLQMCKTYVYERDMVKKGLLDDKKRLYILFKKQLYKWLKYNCIDEYDILEYFEMPFTLDTEQVFEKKEFKNQKMIAIRTEDTALVICIRLQDELVLEDNRLVRRQSEELVRYLREYAVEHKIKPSGCIMYVNVNKNKLNIQPITVNAIGDYLVGETVVDIHDQYKFISNKIQDCYKYFITRTKSKKKPFLNKS